ncbi:MAG: hypothetical protein HOY76_52420 [Streptomyces sp.]|nr:hypothetical protein [Streptomyces sp.]
MTELVTVPYEATEQFGSVENYKTWTWYGDRDAAHWAATPYRHNGDQVLMLLDGDDTCFATRTSLEAVYGPLAEVPHCTTCGDYFWYRNGTCRTLACTQA